ncbi:MAG: L-threonylcarbamoyladenylate synthase [Victivallaceae bacterium]
MEEKLSEAALKMCEGEIVIFPTDTVYGLGVSLYSEKGVEKIFSLKKRSEDKPLAILIACLDDLEGIVSEYSDDFLKLYETFFPGPLTVLLPMTDALKCSRFYSNTPFIGVRSPDHPIPLALIKKLGHPLVATSVNYSGISPEKDLTDIPETIKEQAAVIFEDDESIKGVPSTVISLTPLKILRAGIITKQQINFALYRK